MPYLDESLRKAAVLVSCLPDTDAQVLLARLEPASAGRIRTAIGVLGAVSTAERQGIIQEFLQQRTVPDDPDEGVELDSDLARRLASRRTPDWGGAQDLVARKRDPSEQAPRQNPFDFLLETEADVVAPFLAHESPQTVAVVLSFLQRRQASDLLRRFEPDFQRQVLRRLSHLEDMDPACVDVVIDELRTWIDRQRTAHHAPAGGPRLVRDEIAARKERSDRERLLADLYHDAQADHPDAHGGHRATKENATPAGSPAMDRVENARRKLRFDDLSGLGDADLIHVLSAAPQETLSLALAGADDSVIERITGAVPRREAKRLKRTTGLQGPTRLQDIEAAKQRIAEIATRILLQ